MNVYKDFNYANYILNLNAEDGLLLYFKAIDRNNEIIRKIDDDRLWQAYLQGGQEGQTFDDYKIQIGYYDKLKNQNNPVKETKKNKNLMTNDEKIIEEKRIKDNSVDLRRKIEEQDRLIELNKINNSVEEG
jgi:hypothetical protein